MSKTTSYREELARQGTSLYSFGKGGYIRGLDDIDLAAAYMKPLFGLGL
jgi:hypothetical protein